MGWTENSYSRLIRSLRIVLPLAALGLLSLLFLLWETRSPERPLRYSDADIEALLSEPRMTNPTFTGVTDDGAAIRLTADVARPGAEGAEQGGSAQSPRLLLISPDGGRTVTTAQDARISPDGRHLLLSGFVVVDTAGGYRLAADEVVAALDRSRIESRLPVVAEGPQGRIEAGSFQLDRSGDDGAEVVVFKGGVRLVYKDNPEGSVSP